MNAVLHEATCNAECTSSLAGAAANVFQLLARPDRLASLRGDAPETIK
jgi:hypothetical protein